MKQLRLRFAGGKQGT